MQHASFKQTRVVVLFEWFQADRQQQQRAISSQYERIMCTYYCVWWTTLIFNICLTDVQGSHGGMRSCFASQICHCILSNCWEYGFSVLCCYAQAAGLRHCFEWKGEWIQFHVPLLAHCDFYLSHCIRAAPWHTHTHTVKTSSSKERCVNASATEINYMSHIHYIHFCQNVD